MSKRVKNTTAPKGWGYCKPSRAKLSNNAKRNKALNNGRTAAQGFYLLWGY